MKKNKVLVLVMFLSLIGLSNTTQAAIVGPTAVTDANGQLLGIDGIDLLGDTWNVRFVDGTFNDIFGGLEGMDFLTKTDALAASGALNNVFNGSGFETFTADPSLTRGIDSPTDAWIITPGGTLEQLSVRAGVFNNSDGLNDFELGIWYSRTSDTSELTNGDRVYADWINVSNVPVPAAVWFMGTGLLGLVGYSRKRSQVAA